MVLTKGSILTNSSWTSLPWNGAHLPSDNSSMVIAYSWILHLKFLHRKLIWSHSILYKFWQMFMELYFALVSFSLILQIFISKRIEKLRILEYPNKFSRKCFPSYFRIFIILRTFIFQTFKKCWKFLLKKLKFSHHFIHDGVLGRFILADFVMLDGFDSQNARLLEHPLREGSNKGQVAGGDGSENNISFFLQNFIASYSEPVLNSLYFA